MTDMAQADRTLRTQDRYWQRTNPFNKVDSDPIYKRGDICVIRSHTGVPMMFRIAEQAHFKEWVGCFSYLGD